MKQTQRNGKLQELVLLMRALGYVKEVPSNSTMKVALENKSENKRISIELDESEKLVRVDDGSGMRQLPYDDYKKEVVIKVMSYIVIEDEKSQGEIVQEVLACVEKK